MRPDERLAGVSVFLPAHNEEGNIERVVRGFCEVLPNVADRYEIIVVDDGSTDRTGEVADKLAASQHFIKVVHHARNGGYGKAVISGIRAAREPYVVLCDGDGQFEPRDLLRLAAQARRYDVVIGKRTHRADSMMRRVNGEAWSLLIRLLFGLRVSDIDCGFKVFRRAMLDTVRLRAGGAMISTELLAKLAGRGATIRQLEVSHLPRQSGRSSGASFKVILRAFKELFLLFRELREQTRGSG